MKHSLSYNQIIEINKAKEIKRENRIGLIAGIVLFLMYCFVSNMEYIDCIERGIC